MVKKPIRFNQRLQAGVYRDIKPYTDGRFRYSFVIEGEVKGWYDKQKDAVKRYTNFVKFHTYEV